MSKRFGRTQKNRMRARIAELEMQLMMTEDLARGLGRTVEKQRRMIDEVDEKIRRYCEYSAILPTKRISMQNLQGRPDYEIARMPPLDLFNVSAGEMGAPIADQVMLHSARMHVVQIMCETAGFDDALHTRVQFGNAKTWAYSLSMEALRAHCVDEQYLAREVSQKLIHAIREYKNERR